MGMVACQHWLWMLLLDLAVLWGHHAEFYWGTFADRLANRIHFYYVVQSMKAKTPQSSRDLAS